MKAILFTDHGCHVLVRDRKRAMRAYRDYVHSGRVPVSDTIEAIERYEPAPAGPPPRRLRAA
jgi:hypothetical protein